MRGRDGRLVVALVAASVAVYWRTAYPTITWWDSSNYSLAADTLGLTGAPGSLLLTLLGWPVTKLVFFLTPARALNLFAGVLAATAAVLVFVVAVRVLRLTSAGSPFSGVAAGAVAGDQARLAAGAEDIGLPAAVGAALGALTFAFSATLWEHAIKFTPYVLTAVFTGFILWTMVRWWAGAERSDAWRLLALLAFLFGLDFSVHRTNALLIPGALAWILIRRPRALTSVRAWFAGAGAFLIGLSAQLAVMPIAAATTSPLNMGEPSTWRAFWDYVSLSERGGGFLVSLWPRNAPFWSAQVGDLLHVLRDDFLTPLPVLGWLPAAAAVLGLAAIWRRDRRLGVGLASVLFLQAATTVIYFNIPAGFFRPFDRHYLPVCLTIAVLSACGLAEAARWIARRSAPRGTAAAVPGAAVLGAAVLGAAVLVLVPAGQLIHNWAAHDASRRWFARDFAANELEALPPHAILFTVGDNDTFPLWYVQGAEGVRPDVRVINTSLLNAAWYVRQITRRDPTLPIAHPEAVVEHAKVPALPDSVVVPVRATALELGLPAGATLPTAVTLRPRPMMDMVVPADHVLLDILGTGAWRVPLCFSITAGDLKWLAPYARPYGLYSRIVPVTGVGPDTALRTNLLDRYAYRGYADPSVRLDDFARNIGSAYLNAFTALLDAYRADGASDACRAMASRAAALVPPGRLGIASLTKGVLEKHCDR